MEPPFEPFDCFDDDDRGQDKSRLIKFLTYHPESAPIARCVKAVMPAGDADRIAERDSILGLIAAVEPIDCVINKLKPKFNQLALLSFGLASAFD